MTHGEACRATRRQAPVKVAWRLALAVLLGAAAGMPVNAGYAVECPTCIARRMRSARDCQARGGSRVAGCGGYTPRRRSRVFGRGYAGWSCSSAPKGFPGMSDRAFGAI